MRRRWRLLALRRLRLLESKDGLAFLHQIKPITRNRFEITGVCLEQTHFASLPREQHLLLRDLGLQPIDLASALGQSFVLWDEETNNHEHGRDAQQHPQDTIKLLPDRGFATRAEIAVAWVIH